MTALADWLWANAALTTVMLVVSVVVLVGSLWLCYYVLITIPADYFNRQRPPLAQFRDRPALWWTLIISKNLIGALLVASGLVMFFTPGQGILTLLLGISLLDVPGKHRLERRIIERKSVLKVINRLRARARKPPLEISKVSGAD
jgi:hypothetical protein